MGESFSVGEIVIVIKPVGGRVDNDCAGYLNHEGVIVSKPWPDRGYTMYDVRMRDGNVLECAREALRRRPQPPDWNALATPNELKEPAHV